MDGGQRGAQGLGNRKRRVTDPRTTWSWALETASETKRVNPARANVHHLVQGCCRGSTQKGPAPTVREAAGWCPIPSPARLTAGRGCTGLCPPSRHHQEGGSRDKASGTTGRSPVDQVRTGESQMSRHITCKRGHTGGQQGPPARARPAGAAACGGPSALLACVTRARTAEHQPRNHTRLREQLSCPLPAEALPDGCSSRPPKATGQQGRDQAGGQAGSPRAAHTLLGSWSTLRKTRRVLSRSLLRGSNEIMDEEQEGQATTPTPRSCCH